MTLIELILAVGLMALVTTIAFLSYQAAVRAWRTGTELSNNIHQGDYIMEQLVMGLRSAYKPPQVGTKPGYGFMLDDDGDSASARDTIRWSKLGTSLIGADSPYAGMPHVVEVSVQDLTDARGKQHTGLAVRSWRLDLQQADFEAEKVPTVMLSTRVLGFNCRTLDLAKQNSRIENEKPELKWDDEWVNSNSLPAAVEITLYLPPTEEGKDPLEMKRIVRIPMSDQSAGR
jgi:type II secretory pathway pseudopilin PulG